MLTDLYAELVNLHLEVQKLAGGSRERDAALIFDRILEVEGQITEIPAQTLADAVVKLRFLRVEIGAELAEHQRRMLDETIAILRKATEH